MAAPGIYIVLTGLQLKPGTLFRREDDHNYIFNEDAKMFQNSNDTLCTFHPLTEREYQLLKTVDKKQRVNVMKQSHFAFIRDMKKGDEVRSVKDKSAEGPLDDIKIDDEGLMNVPVKGNSALKKCHWHDLRPLSKTSNFRSDSRSSSVHGHPCGDTEHPLSPSPSTELDKLSPTVQQQSVVLDKTKCGAQKGNVSMQYIHGKGLRSSDRNNSSSGDSRNSTNQASGHNPDPGGNSGPPLPLQTPQTGPNTPSQQPVSSNQTMELTSYDRQKGNASSRNGHGMELRSSNKKSFSQDARNQVSGQKAHPIGDSARPSHSQPQQTGPNTRSSANKQQSVSSTAVNSRGPQNGNVPPVNSSSRNEARTNTKQSSQPIQPPQQQFHETAFTEQKPFIGEECLLNENGRGSRGHKIVDWTFGKDGKLKFTLKNGWVCDAKDVTVVKNRTFYMEEETVEIAKKYLVEQGLEESATEHKDTADQTTNLQSSDWVLMEPPKTNPKFENLLLGALVNVLPVGGFNPVVQNGILRWIGNCEGLFKAVVEHVSSDASGVCQGESAEGVVVDGKWLWRSSTGRCCHWVAVDLIQSHSTAPSRPPGVETRQLDCIQTLGSHVSFRSAAGPPVSGRVLWMGLIQGLECVLLETPEPVEQKLYLKVDVDPMTFYPAHEPGTGREDLVFLPCNLFWDNPNPNTSVTQPSSPGNAVHGKGAALASSYNVADSPQRSGNLQSAAPNNPVVNQPQSLTTNMEDTTHFYSLKFCQNESPQNLENMHLGDTVLVNVHGNEYKGLLCWIGMNVRENRWLVGVELPRQIHIPHHKPTDGTFQDQRLWFPFQQDVSCYLLPAEMVSLSSSSKYRRKFTKGWNNTFQRKNENDISLIANYFTLGQHVLIYSEQYLACVVWTGKLSYKDYIVVKLALPEIQRKWTHKNPNDITHHKNVTGFYGELVLVQPDVDHVNTLEHQMHIPRVETVNDHLLNKSVLVPMGDKYENGFVRWAGRIDGGMLHFGLEMQTKQLPRANDLVLAAVVHTGKCNRRNYLWMLPYSVGIKEQRIFQRALPHEIMPPGLALGKRMKVTFADDDNSEMIFGVVRWTGLVDNQWRVALETMEVLPPLWIQHGERAAELNLPPHKTLVVDPVNVSQILQKDEAMMRRQTQQPASPSKPPPRTDKFNGIPYERQFFEQLVPLNPSEAGLQFGLNYLIQVELEGRKGVRAGVCRFVGLHRTEKTHFVGVELTHKTSEGGTNGTFPDVGGVKLFECPDKFGVLVASRAARPVDLPIPVRPPSPYVSMLASLSRLAPPVVKVWCGVPHCHEFISTLRVAERRPEDMDFEVGFLVEVQLPETHFPPSGECRWIGWDATGTACFVGVELDQPVECEAVTDGQFCGRRLFQCRDRHGVLLPSSRVKLHRTIVRERENTERRVEALDDSLKGQTLVIHQDEALPCDFTKTEYVMGFKGPRGIQGRQNSCYMDTTLFSMFALNDSFDEMLRRSENESKTMQLLREAIVNPLRRDWFVSQANVMAFREAFEEEGKTQGMKTQQKDPEEFMQVLFEKISKVPPFLTYKSNDKSHIMQLFFVTNPVHVISVEKMLELTFRDMGRDPWTDIPENLIMLIPRDGQEFSGFKVVKHNLSLNVAPYLTADCRGRRKCNVQTDCPEASSFNCNKCPFWVCAFHAVQREKRLLCPNCNIPLNSPFSLELYAVLCIEISHFVAFLRVPPSSREQCGQWLFFDSMSDRHGDINVPLVKRLEGNTDQWLEDFQSLQDLHKAKASAFLKRLVTNPYVLFYRDARRRDVDALVAAGKIRRMARVREVLKDDEIVRKKFVYRWSIHKSTRCIENVCLQWRSVDNVHVMIRYLLVMTHEMSSVPSLLIGEYEAGDLQTFLDKRARPLQENEMWMLFFQLIFGLAYLEPHGIVHTDVRRAVRTVIGCIESALCSADAEEPILNLSDCGQFGVCDSRWRLQFHGSPFGGFQLQIVRSTLGREVYSVELNHLEREMTHSRCLEPPRDSEISARILNWLKLLKKHST